MTVPSPIPAGRARARRWLPLLLLALAACGGGGDGPSGPAPPASITLATPTLTLQGVGATQTVSATVRDQAGNALSGTPITWTSETPAVATATGTGASATITAVNRGTTTVRATAGTASAALTVTVRAVQGVAIQAPPTTLRAGDTLTLRATVTADSGIGTGVTWSADNPTVATVTPAGRLTAIAPGVVTITAAATAQPALTARAQITVTPPRSFGLRPDTVRIARSQTATLTADLILEAGLSRALTFRSSNPGVATVSNEGVITGVAAGTATITGLVNVDTTLRRTVTAIVSPLVTGVTVTPTNAQLFINQALPLTATVQADAGANTLVRWVSTNPAIATVNAQGVVTGVALGFTTVTAISLQDTTRQAGVQVNVVRRPIEVRIIPTPVGISLGQSAPMGVEVIADPGVPTTVTWTSANPAVASIDRTTGVLTGVALGTTTITATSAVDAARSATAQVTVSPRLAARWTASRLNGPLIEDVTGVWCPVPSACFAINGTNGELVQRDPGGEWRVVLRAQQLGGRRVRAIAGTRDDATRAFAVGTGGLLLRWTGSAWVEATSGTTADLVAVSLGADEQALAVGAAGTVVRLRAGQWSRVPAPPGTAQLNGVGEGQGLWFVVGAGGTFLRLADTTWSRIETNTTEDLFGVVGLSGTAAVAVGGFGTVLDFNAGTVTVSPSGVTADLRAITRAPSGQLFAVGDGAVISRAQGASDWTRLTPPWAVQLFSAFHDATSGLWVGGQRGLVMELRGTWTTRNLAPDLLSVWTVNPTTAFAVGELGFIYRWDGSTWARQTAPTTLQLNGVWAANATTVFAVGDSGTVLRTTDGGTTWRAVPTPSRTRLAAIWGASPTDAWAASIEGELLRWNGTAWALVEPIAPAALLGLFGTATNDIWTVGDQGLVQRWTGTAWARSTTGSSALLNGIWTQGTGAGAAAFAVGEVNSGAAVLRFGAGSWQAVANPGTTARLSSVWGTNLFDLYVAGEGGTIVRFDGTRWTAMPTGVTDFLWSINGLSAGQAGFAVGFNSTMLTAGSGPSSILAAGGGRAASLEPAPGVRRTVRLLPRGAARMQLRPRRGR
jgi:uncharacterized protein YjdB/photosystem II stability/assembly factor-like uncharacterized protein